MAAVPGRARHGAGARGHRRRPRPPYPRGLRRHGQPRRAAAGVRAAGRHRDRRRDPRPPSPRAPTHGRCPSSTSRASSSPSRRSSFTASARRPRGRSTSSSRAGSRTTSGSRTTRPTTSAGCRTRSIAAAWRLPSTCAATCTSLQATATRSSRTPTRSISRASRWSPTRPSPTRTCSARMIAPPRERAWHRTSRRSRPARLRSEHGSPPRPSGCERRGATSFRARFRAPRAVRRMSADSSPESAVGTADDGVARRARLG